MEWYVFAIIASVLTAASSIVEKKTLMKEHAMEFSATLAYVIMFLSLPFFLMIDYSRLEIFPILIMFLVSIIAAFAFLYVAKATRHMQVSDASPLLALGPAVTLLTAYIFLGETIKGIQVLGMGVLILGAYALETKNHQKLTEPLRIFFKSKYIHYILLSLVLYSLTATIDRTMLSRYNVQPEAYIAIVHFFLALNFLVMMSVMHNGLKGIKHGLRNNGWWLLLAAVLTLSYRYSQLQAVRVAEVGLVSAIKRTSTFFTVILAGEFFHETNILRKSAAALIILAGAAIIILA